MNPPANNIVNPTQLSHWWWFIVQCDTPQEAIDWVLPDTPAAKYACWRPHAAPTTGQPHVHCLAYFKSVVRFSALQAKGYANVKWVQSDPKKRNCRAYCVRDGKPGQPSDVIGPLVEVGQLPKCMVEKAPQPEKRVFSDVMDPSVSYEGALEAIKACAPRDYLLYHNQIEGGLKKVKKVKVEWTPRFMHTRWVLPNALIGWMQDQMVLSERAKCLVLVGPSRMGKTEWARHLFPYSHMYFRNLFNVDKWDTGAQLLIFDDIEWGFIPQKKSLLTHMGEAEVTDKYRPKQTIHVRMPAVVLLNELPDFGTEWRYWQANTQVVEIDGPLYPPPPTPPTPRLSLSEDGSSFSFPETPPPQIGSPELFPRELEETEESE